MTSLHIYCIIKIYKYPFYGDLAEINPIRYRGYVYDFETGFYYLQSRYYDPQVKRFINADDASLLGANGNFASFNLFSYCGNNPIVRKDSAGTAWETVFDIISLASSVADVVANPANPWAWASLIGDVVDVAVPFVTGLGEATKVAKTTVRLISGTEDVVSTAKAVKNTAEATSDIKKATGTYVILFKNGQNYVGKGGFGRAIKSAETHQSAKNMVTSIIWAPTSSEKNAFISEYLLQTVRGVGRKNEKTFNIIWSPGKHKY